MKVKEAVHAAKAHIADIFEDEDITRIGLEEVDFDSAREEWRVTIGFNRAWTANSAFTAAVTSELYRNRSFKVVRIKNLDGELTSIEDRLLSAQS